MINITTKEILQYIYEKITLEIESLSDSNTTYIVLCHHDIHPGNIIKKETRDLELIELGNIICEFYTDYSTESYNYYNHFTNV
jgi:thiamine kinase-like enzyme